MPDPPLRQSSLASAITELLASNTTNQLHQQQKQLLSRLSPLVVARSFAIDVGVDAWQFAVELEVLLETMNQNEIRWLTQKRIIQHAFEIYVDEGRTGARQFEPIDSLTFNQRSCFVLTPMGFENAVNSCADLSNSQMVTFHTTNENEQPIWDKERNELRFGQLLIKEYKLPSPNQEAILNAFEEEGWPPRIDDPLTPHPDIDPKRRLHDTIKSLNRNQRIAAIRFRGDGSGQGVRWGSRTPELADQGRF